MLDTNTIWYNITIGGNVPSNPIPNPDDPNQDNETILEETLTFENGFAIIPDDNFELGNLTTGTYDFYLDGNRFDSWALVVPDEGTMLVTEDKTIYAIGEEEDSHLGDFIEDDRALSPGDVAESNMLKEQLIQVLNTLTPREEKVLRLRYGLDDSHPRTLEEVGKEFNVTRERIRQIEAKALRKLRHPNRLKKLKDFD